MPKMIAPKRRIDWRMALRISMWLLILASVAFAAREVQSFLREDDRFALANLQIDGATFTNRARIQSVFEPDFKKSVFRIPLDERRRHLLAIDWVRTAVVSRVWPGKIVVTITERQPAAFAKLPIAGSIRHRMALVDDDGVLLALPPRVRFRLPVLSGVAEEQTDEERKIRVKAMRHLLEDLGQRANDISEVNAASVTDMRVIADVEGRGVELWLGDQHYRSRFANFLRHYGEIRRHSEQAGVFDLRMDDRISAR